MIKDVGIFFVGGRSEEKVKGELIINESGEIQLNIDKIPSEINKKRDIFGTENIPDKFICGELLVLKKYVLLTDLYYTAGFSSTYTQLAADYCIVSDAPIELNAFEKLKLPIDNLNNWYLSGLAQQSMNDGNCCKYEINKKDDEVWNIDCGELKLVNSISQKIGYTNPAKISVSLQSFFLFEFNDAVSVKSAHWYLTKLEELISLLVLNSFNFPNPQVVWRIEERVCVGDVYFRRFDTPRSSIYPDGCSINFDDISGELGRLFDKWIYESKSLGAGAHLYMSVIKNPKLYIDHMFTTLVIGLESYSNMIQVEQTHDGLRKRKEKLKLLSELIDDKDNDGKYKHNRHDRKSLKDLLKPLGELQLSEKLHLLLSELPCDFDDTKLFGFCKTVASLRNSFSHNGGFDPRYKNSYQTFVDNIRDRLYILKTIYALILLNHIGVSSDIIIKIARKAFIKSKVEELSTLSVNFSKE